jgi:hypothetical protein
MTSVALDAVPPGRRGRELAYGTPRPCRHCRRPATVIVLLTGLCLTCSDMLIINEANQ